VHQSHSSGTFFYQVTAENEGGETSASNEPSATAGGANPSILIQNFNASVRLDTGFIVEYKLLRCKDI